MAIGRYCQITGQKKRAAEVVAEAHGIVVTAPALMEKVFGDPPAARDEVRSMARYCAVCGAEQPGPPPGECVSCGSALDAETARQKLSEAGETPRPHKRAAAFLIDLFLVVALAWAAVYGVGLYESARAESVRVAAAEEALSEGAGEADLFLFLKILAAAGVFVCYHSLFLFAANATPGKLLSGLRVVRKDGARELGAGRTLLRSLLYLFTLYVVPIGFLPLVFQEEKSEWLGIVERDAMFHNSLTDTEVVEVR